ncbi:MAG: hypothetical protein J6O55_01655, partial [Lachnospiraceae bacterium]|nr:hypothetical protein [Lachnospiraceae bacterium]
DVNLSDRNVSASRLAEDLGLDFVMKSKSAILSKDGKGVRVNMMESASGTTLSDLKREIATANSKVDDIRSAELAKMQQVIKKNPEKIKEIEDFINNNFKRIELCYTPKALGQIMQMQVFDLIIGNVDRHAANYHVNVDKSDPYKWLITDIQAIDNDMSFGNMSADEMESGEIGRLIPIMRKNGVTIPALDEEFYDNLMNYSVEELRKSQFDLRSEDELDALESRFKRVKESLAKLVEAGDVKLIKKDDSGGWKTAFESLQKMRNEKNGSRYSSDNSRQDTYFLSGIGFAE